MHPLSSHIDTVLAGSKHRPAPQTWLSVACQAELGAVTGAITGTITNGTLAGYANNRWNPGYDVTGTPGSLPADFVPTSVFINGVQCKYSRS